MYNSRISSTSCSSHCQCETRCERYGLISINRIKKTLCHKILWLEVQVCSEFIGFLLKFDTDWLRACDMLVTRWIMFTVPYLLTAIRRFVYIYSSAGRRMKRCNFIYENTKNTDLLQSVHAWYTIRDQLIGFLVDVTTCASSKQQNDFQDRNQIICEDAVFTAGFRKLKFSAAWTSAARPQFGLNFRST